MSEAQRVAVVTGANRGLGFAVSRQLARRGLRTVLTSRDGLQGKAAVDKLQAEGLDVALQPLDLNREESLQRLRDRLAEAYGRVDVLVNNAGIFPEREGRDGDPGLLEVPREMLELALGTNALGPLRLTQLLLPLMRRHDYGRIVNVSSGYGQLSRMGRGYPAYRLSKAALNAVTCQFAAETRDENILVNAVDPGWVQTRMGGPQAPTPVDEAAGWIAQAALLDDDGPSGRFLRRGEPVEW